MVTRIAAHLVTAADAASMTTFRDGRPSAVAFSDEWAKELDPCRTPSPKGRAWTRAAPERLPGRGRPQRNRRPNLDRPRVGRRGTRGAVSIALSGRGKNFVR